MNLRNKTYKGYTLDEAKSELSTWKEAKKAAATGKSYNIGSRSLTRYDLSEINKEIQFFSNIVDVLSNSSTGLTKVIARQIRR